MTRNKNLLVVLFFSIFLFSACTSSVAQKNNLSNEFRRPDFGQPERKSDIRGLVKSISGNEITILKIERLALGKSGEIGSSETKDATKATSLGQASKRMPGMGGGARFSGYAKDQAAILERMKEMSTGEEKILIPVGIQMLKANPTNQKAGPIEATLTDVKKDIMIQVWLDGDVSDRNIAEFVMITR